MSWTKQLWKKPMLKVEPILKKDVTKNIFEYTSPDGTVSFIDQDIGEIRGKIKQEFIRWQNKCRSLSLKRIGVTGGEGYTDKNKPPNKQFEKNLLGHLENHVTASHSRKDEGKRGMGYSLDKIREILGTKGDGKLITEEDVEDIKAFLDKILRMWDGKSKDGKSLNPRDIVFTVPTGLKKIKTKGGKTKWTKTGETEVYGHYRTPDYVRYRKKVKGAKGEQGAVPDSWYSTTKPSDAKPPMYQAIFSGSSKDKTPSDLLGGKGLLGILERFYEDLSKVKIKTLTPSMNASGGAKYKEEKVKTLLSFQPFLTALENIMSNEMYFKGGGYKNYLNAGKVLQDLAKIPLAVNGDKGKSQLMETFADISDVQGHEHIESVQITITAAILNMAINRHIRSKGGKALLSPRKHNGVNFPFVLSDAGGGKRGDWISEWDKLMEQGKAKLKKKQPKKEVKKSWVDSLWS